MEDIEVACSAVSKTAGEIGMTEDDSQTAKDLILKYGDEREAAFGQMLSLLGKDDTSDLVDSWKSRCEAIVNLLDQLNGQMPETGEGEGLSAVGAGDFYAGEKKVWQENAKGDIASVASVLSKIYDADLELIKKCDEDLRTVREGDKIVEALVQENFGGITARVKNYLLTLPSKAPQAFNLWLKDSSAKEYTRQLSENLKSMLTANLNAARQKRAFKQQIVDNMELLERTREQLDEGWINEMFAKGEEYARSLAGLASGGTYIAADWGPFGESCIRILAESRDRSKEQSQKLFGELLPTFLEENNRAFAALTDDPSTLTAWKSGMEEDFQSIDDVFAQQNEFVASLAEGPYKQAMFETLKDLVDLVVENKEAVSSATREAEEEMSK